MLTRRQMHSDLMRATRFKTDIKEGMGPKMLCDPVVSHGGLTVGHHRHFGSGGRVAPNRLSELYRHLKNVPRQTAL